jgi:hypothetical protein
MTKKELEQCEREINTGLAAAQRVIDSVVAKLKLETPSQPLGSLETQAMFGQENIILAGLAQIKQIRKALQRATEEKDYAV